MNDPIEKLIRFQEKDHVRATLARKRELIPATLEAAEAKLARRKATEERVQSEIDVARAGRVQAEKDAEHERAKIAERELKLRQVRTNEEFQAGMRELTEQRKKINAFEDVVLARMEELEGLEGQLATASQDRESEETVVAGARDDVELELAEIDEQIEAARAAAATLEPEVEPALLKLYRQVSESIHEDPIVEVVSGTCRGCFMGVPLQLYNELHDPAITHTCPSCHRILYVTRDETEDETEPSPV